MISRLYVGARGLMHASGIAGSVFLSRLLSQVTSALILFAHKQLSTQQKQETRNSRGTDRAAGAP